jgi:tuberous sclerosis protein 2
MPVKENNINFKKKHIGNDNTIIVYNESGEEYNFGFIKGEVNCVCIEIEPLKSGINTVKVKTTNEMQQHWTGHQDQKVISDQNLPLLTRKMALHADLAARVYRSQKDNLYGGKWLDRLRQINRIRETCKKNTDISQHTSSSTSNDSSKYDYHDFTEHI